MKKHYIEPALEWVDIQTPNAILALSGVVIATDNTPVEVEPYTPTLGEW